MFFLHFLFITTFVQLFLDRLKVSQFFIIRQVDPDAVLVLSTLGSIIIVNQWANCRRLVEDLHILGVLLSPIELIILGADEMLVWAIILMDVTVLIRQILLAQQSGAILQILL